jgi:hypothetical protein
MKVQVTWNKTVGDKPTEVYSINPDDPHKDDRELQLAKARAAASVSFNAKYHEYPPAEQLSAEILD